MELAGVPHLLLIFPLLAISLLDIPCGKERLNLDLENSEAPAFLRGVPDP